MSDTTRSSGDTAELLAAEIQDPLAELADPDFPLAIRGYDRATVDAYVRRVTEVVAELHALRSPRAAINRALERVGEETSAILQRAQQSADELTASSRARADERIQLAEREAEGITAGAAAKARQLDADTEDIWRERRRLIEDTRRLADALAAVADNALLRFPAENETGSEGEAAPEEREVPFDGDAHAESNGTGSLEESAEAAAADTSPEEAPAQEGAAGDGPASANGTVRVESEATDPDATAEPASEERPEDGPPRN